MRTEIRILLIDDHPVVRDGLRAMLATQEEFNVIGEAADGSEALLKIKKYQPDVILLDLEIQGKDGIQVLQEMKRGEYPAKAIVFTAFDTDERIVKAIQAGAKGYLLKGVPRDTLFHAIRVAFRGGSLLHPLTASKLTQNIDKRPVLSQGNAVSLTARENDVLDCLANGMTNKEIASQLVISERTVKFHVSSILQKLGAGNRTEAVTIAAQRGLITL